MTCGIEGSLEEFARSEDLRLEREAGACAEFRSNDDSFRCCLALLARVGLVQKVSRSDSDETYCEVGMLDKKCEKSTKLAAGLLQRLISEVTFRL